LLRASIAHTRAQTALHKAALAGRLPALTFLLSRGASANAVDFDGWTPLHNACARGYLDIVRVLCENAEAIVDAKGGRGEWTPLMNAAAGGHVTVVRYLCTKSQADPFARNTAGETAYDIAAATFETYVCEVLEKYEAERWAALRLSHATGSGDARQTRASAIQQAYNPLRLHSTVPVILHENQRLDTRLSTLAVHGGKPRWSGTSAGRPHKPDRRAPGTMPPGPLSTSRTRNAPMRREDVGLPLRENPYKLVLPTRAAQIAAANARRHAAQGLGESELGSTPTPQSVLDRRASGSSSLEREMPNGERCHFWLSDWQPDLTHPLVDAHDGWQYAQSFDAPDERWSAAVPPPLARLLEGRGLGSSVTRAITGGALPGPGQTSVNGVGGEQEAVPTGWVRRRRWVRVIRRRLDIDFGDELEAAEIAQYSSAAYAEPGASLKPSSVVAAEQEAREAAASLGPSADYVARARALAGLGAASGSTPADAMGEGADELRRRIARLDLAISELRGSAFSDADSDRQSRAEDMLKEYTLQLGQLRQAIGIEEEGSEDEDSDAEEFIYPNSYKDDGQSVITRIGLNQTSSAAVRPGPPVRVGSSASAFGAAAPSEAGVSFAAMRSADLAAASEFRVPTHEVPNRFSQPVGAATLREQNLVPTWQSDDTASECPDCQRRFTFFVRKHHCRRCGQIRCDRCSSHRVHLSAAELVIDPAMPEMLITESSGPTRICNACNADRQLPPGTAVRSLLSQLPSSHTESDLPSSMSDVSSRASELNECPVCSTTLATLGDSITQEEHVRVSSLSPERCEAACSQPLFAGVSRDGRRRIAAGRTLPGLQAAGYGTHRRQGVRNLPRGPAARHDHRPSGTSHLCAHLRSAAAYTLRPQPCLCYFHRACIDSWFSRGKACPTHARTW
jgi:hypothetical protein